MMLPTFTFAQQSIIEMCAEECARQKTKPGAVSNMIAAYNHVMRVREVISHIWPLTIEFIVKLGQLVEPEKVTGIRTTSVMFSNGSFGLSPFQIEPALERLCGAMNTITPEEFYQEFETIHPFLDGNGRVGFILYNYLKDTLEHPIVPPEYKDRHALKMENTHFSG